MPKQRPPNLLLTLWFDEKVCLNCRREKQGMVYGLTTKGITIIYIVAMVVVFLNVHFSKSINVVSLVFFYCFTCHFWCNFRAFFWSSKLCISFSSLLKNEPFGYSSLSFLWWYVKNNGLENIDPILTYAAIKFGT